MVARRCVTGRRARGSGGADLERRRRRAGDQGADDGRGGGAAAPVLLPVGLRPERRTRTFELVPGHLRAGAVGGRHDHTADRDRVPRAGLGDRRARGDLPRARHLMGPVRTAAGGIRRPAGVGAVNTTAVDDDLWSAIGDPTRRRMLDILLAAGPGTATSLR